MTETYYWGVPISSAAPYLAHLIRDGRAATHKLCSPGWVVNRETTLAVDGLRYELKCRICRAMGLEFAMAQYAASDLRTSAQIGAMRHLLFPRTPSGKRKPAKRRTR